MKTDENNIQKDDEPTELKDEENVEGEKADENVEVLQIKNRGSTAKREKKLKTKGQRNLSRKRNKSGGDDEQPMSEEIPVISPIKPEDIREAVEGAKVLKVGDRVFAKWEQRTDVRYWPGEMLLKYFGYFECGRSSQQWSFWSPLLK